MDKYKISVLNYIFSRILSFRKAHSCAAKIAKKFISHQCYVDVIMFYTFKAIVFYPDEATVKPFSLNCYIFYPGFRPETKRQPVEQAERSCGE